MHLEKSDQLRRKEYFQDIAEAFTPDIKPSSVIITHLLPDRSFFIEGVNTVAPVVAIFPKPKSVSPPVEELLRSKFSIIPLDRGRFRHATAVLADIDKVHSTGYVVLLDVGGYFAPILTELVKSLGERLLGVVEDTENGAQRYESIPDLPCPVVSVARSPLKYPEDYLVGQSIVHSTETLLRANGDILHGRSASVVGYGKIGRSIANLLHAKRVATRVYDRDPARLIEAMAHGFPVEQNLHDAIRDSGLLICATGNLALNKEDFRHVMNGAYIATVTSSDDELNLEGLRETRSYTEIQIDNFITKLSTDGHYFYLLNQGNAVNFIHGAHVGPFIFLVQAEIIAAISMLASARSTTGSLLEVSNEDRQTIATVWLKHFAEHGFATR